MDAEGIRRWYQTTKIPLRDTDNKVSGLVGVSRDITERKRLEDRVRQLAFYDALTNLPNRRLLDDRLHQSMVSSRRSGCLGALMFFLVLLPFRKKQNSN